MNDLQLEARLVASSPVSHETAFVGATMERIRMQDQPIARRRSPAWYYTFRRMNLALQLLAAALALAISGGAIYAASRFLPSAVKVTNESQTTRGTSQYTATGVAECDQTGNESGSYELKRDAPKLSTEEVQKILQARCELRWLDTFVAETWPAKPAEKKSNSPGDVYYTRLDTLGKLVSVSGTSATINSIQGVDGDKTYTVLSGEQVTSYDLGQKIELGQLKAGDPVFTVVGAHDRFTPVGNGSFTNATTVDGLVAVIRLSLPFDYYTTKQNYLTAFTACTGNASETCGGQTASIDVYPRAGGEGASNPYLNESYTTHLDITGIVSALSGNSLTLQSRSNQTYTVTLSEPGFTDYNNTYAKNYTDVDATLRLGSYVTIRYQQPAGANPHIISGDQVFRVELLLDGLNVKAGDAKPY